MQRMLTLCGVQVSPEERDALQAFADMKPSKTVSIGDIRALREGWIKIPLKLAPSRASVTGRSVVWLPFDDWVIERRRASPMS